MLNESLDADSSQMKIMLEYVNAARSSSERGRIVLVVLVTASVLACASVWNSLPFSWTNQRLVFAQKDFQACVDNPNNKASINACEIRRLDVKDLSETQTSEIKAVKIPFFNCSLDIDDLGLVSGFAFLITLGWFRSVLWSEGRNINVTFAAGRCMCMDVQRAAYELLSMHQNLMAPEPLHYNRQYANNEWSANHKRITKIKNWIFKRSVITRLWLWAYKFNVSGNEQQLEQDIRRRVSRWFVYGMCFMPILVQLSICCVDLCTRQDGYHVHWLHTIFNLCLEWLFLVCDVIVTTSCISQMLKTDMIWKWQHDQIDLPR